MLNILEVVLSLVQSLAFSEHLEINVCRLWDHMNWYTPSPITCFRDA